MMKCNITVLKRTLHKDLADEFCLQPVEACPVFVEGRQYVYDHFGEGNKPEGFCEHAWHDIYMDVITLMSNGDHEGWMKNKGMRNTRQTSIAKWFATDASFDAASEAIQVHGAYGYSDEYNVERYLRNSRGAVIYEGTSEIHQLMQAGYALGYREDAPLRRELPAYNEKIWQEP